MSAADQALEQIVVVLDELTAVRSRYAGYLDNVSVLRPPQQVLQELEQAETRCRAALERFAAPDSAYRKGLDGTFDVRHSVISRLTALKQDVEAGYTRSIEELLHADVFGDFLEMADELLRVGYKDPAAVLAGSVLEEHLRKLGGRVGVPVENDEGRPLKADRLNADLAKCGAYNKHDQKSITAWLDLRNNAAHGHFDRYDGNQVAALIRDVRAFMIRHPA